LLSSQSFDRLAIASIVGAVRAIHARVQLHFMEAQIRRSNGCNRMWIAPKRLIDRLQ
jgi:hypothetical protein